MNTKYLIEALLFATDKPLSLYTISKITNISESEIVNSINELKQDYETRGIKIIEIAGGYQFATSQRYHEFVKKLNEINHRNRLSKQALEVLSIIAYKQPITKQEIEQLRGVDPTSSLNTLLERRLIKITGRKKVLGAPFLYKTTDEFLKCFGLNSLNDLPKINE